ncbi:MAG TPA: hypothetical protein VK752_06535 [Bryobacteraceae bacterium]|jgi:hypothetical protein|nr:hypothetical protein [Bryobacteraceae bacterium]
MALRYMSGEEIKAGDHILYGHEPGQIEFVVGPGQPPPPEWDLEQIRVGCMILAPSFGRVFDQPDEDLEFISRGQLPPK